jgi:hypothetical protein
MHKDPNIEEMKASKEIIWIKSVSFAAVQRGAMI